MRTIQWGAQRPLENDTPGSLRLVNWSLKQRRRPSLIGGRARGLRTRTDILREARAASYRACVRGVRKAVVYMGCGRTCEQKQLCIHLPGPQTVAF